MSKEALQWTEKEVAIADLQPAEYNPRKMTDKERADLTDSVKEFGPVVPVVANIGKRQNVLIGGHQRCTIYKELGYEKVRVLYPNRELTLKEEKKLNLRLNKNTGSWDYEKLKDIDLVVLLDVGFGDEELQVFFDGVEMFEDDFMMGGKPKEEPEAKTQTGMVWQCGEHRVMCGDAYKPEDVATLMDGKQADMLWLDPPLSLDKPFLESLKGEKSAEAKYMHFLATTMRNAKEAAKPNAHNFVWTAEESIWMAQVELSNLGGKNRRMLVWIKKDQKLTAKVAFNKIHETCMYGTYGNPYINTNVKNLNQLLNAELSSGNQLPEEVAELITIQLDQKEKGGEYDITVAKPVTLAEKPLKRCTSPGHIVLDMFGGSGSMLVACQQLKRTCYTMEKDPRMVDLIVKRWEELTNKKAKAL